MKLTKMQRQAVFMARLMNNDHVLTREIALHLGDSTIEQLPENQVVENVYHEADLDDFDFDDLKLAMLGCGTDELLESFAKEILAE